MEALKDGIVLVMLAALCMALVLQDTNFSNRFWNWWYNLTIRSAKTPAEPMQFSDPEDPETAERQDRLAAHMNEANYGYGPDGYQTFGGPIHHRHH